MTTIKRKVHVLPWYNPYVTKGLTAMWDGEWNTIAGHHEPDVSVWTDIVGGRIISLSEAPIVEGKAICLSTVRYATAIPADILAMLGDDKSYTLELFHTPRNESKTESFMVQRHDSYTLRISCMFADNKSHWIANATSYNDLSRENDRGFHAAVVHAYPNDRLFLNGTLVKAGSSELCSVAVRLVFGCHFVNCLRIYNRTLSDEEVSINFAVDQERFMCGRR